MGVHNLTKEVRIVLLVRFWHPSLNTAALRKDALARIEADLASSQRLQLLPPLAPGWKEPGPALEAKLRSSVEGEVCRACGCEGAESDLSLDDARGHAILTARCCG